MATQNPFALQNRTDHTAALFRQAVFSGWRQGGIVGPNDLQVSAQGTPNMSVQVSAGRAWMVGTQIASVSGGDWSPQAAYFGINDAPLSVSISTADATNPRIDLICAYVQDQFYSGSSNQLLIGAVTGTPAPSPAAPSAPSNAIVLAQVAVAANATSIVSGNISNTAGLMTVARGGILPVTSSDSTSGKFVGQYRDHPTSALQRWNGSAWGLPLYDSGWSDVSGALGAGFTVGSDGCHTRQIGSLMLFQLHVVRATSTTTGTVYTFPSGKRPAWNHWWLWEAAGTAQAEAKLTAADGTLSFGAGGGTGTGCVVSGVFPIG